MDELIEKYKPKIATAVQHGDWVFCEARPIDIEKEKELVSDLSQIMDEYIKANDWLGVSSNNIYWNGTEIPIRLIRVPSPEDKLITVANPEIKVGKERYLSVEGCACLPNREFLVERRFEVILRGYVLEDDCFREMEYNGQPEGGRRYFGKTQLIMGNKIRQSPVQHECDHLDGITILRFGYELKPIGR